MCATLRPLCLLSQRFSQLHLQHLPAPRSGGKEGPELLVQLWCCSQFHSPLQRSVSKAMGRAQLWSQGSKQLPRTVPAANAGSGGEGKGSAKSGTVSPWEEWKHRMLPWEHRNNQRCFSLSWRSPGAAAPPEEGERANPEEEREQTRVLLRAGGKQEQAQSDPTPESCCGSPGATTLSMLQHPHPNIPVTKLLLLKGFFLFDKSSAELQKLTTPTVTCA